MSSGHAAHDACAQLPADGADIGGHFAADIQMVGASLN